jgi:DNA-binding transcriptional MerR regulator
VSSRSYLSIGDVLTLLREEFPDVTISKIRFLESQGLVNPERSPSGYRKFFEHDVERLRWVLRQQREHFLPLKVIRDRLAEGDVDETTDLGPVVVAEAGAEVEVEARAESESARHGNGRVAEPAHAGVGAAAGAGAHGRHVAGAGSGGAGAGTRSDDALTQADSDAMARILADASRRSALLPESGRGVTRHDGAAGTPAVAAAVPSKPTSTPTANAGALGGASTTAGREHRTAPAAARPANVSPPAGDRAAGKGVDVVAEAVAAAARGGDASAKSAAGSGVGAGATGAKEAERGQTPTSTGKGEQAKPARAAAASGTSTSMVTGASLTGDELCAASGLNEAELASLQGFGLIAAAVVAGIPTYDEDALTVANLAAELRVFGIEPRHLRLYKNAVDREVGLIEQVIIPLLRQRNPESRQRAIESAEQLGTLGQTMRATLLRAALRQHLGG